MVRNVHTRLLRAPADEVGLLLDGVGGPQDELWPGDRWPRLRLDRGLGVGSAGGHGPVRYSVERYVPGRSVSFRFAPSLGLIGTHTLELVAATPTTTTLRHVLEGRPVGVMRLGWPLAVRWLHDACIEDLLDRAELRMHGAVARPARWSRWVRLLRALQARRTARSARGGAG